MNEIFIDAKSTDDQRRECLYDGSLYIYTSSPSTLKLSQLGREMAEEAFAPLDPRVAQYELPVEQYASILSELKPKFIHHPKSKECIQAILDEFGCDLEKTYFDVPRMRTSTARDYLTTGIAYAFHPHRDTWYSAPMCQINWWFPIYELDADNGIGFHPEYWSNPLRNGSSEYNYQQWVETNRFNAAEYLTEDTREQPKPLDPVDLDPRIRPIVPVGSLLLFAAAHLHSSVPNASDETRFSIDFRTVHYDDAREKRGAPNYDSACTGTAMGDFLRGTDLAHLPDDIIASYMKGTPIIQG